MGLCTVWPWPSVLFFREFTQLPNGLLEMHITTGHRFRFSSFTAAAAAFAVTADCGIVAIVWDSERGRGEREGGGPPPRRRDRAEQNKTDI